MQFVLTGTRGRSGDFDAVLQLAVAPDDVLLVCIMQACSSSGYVKGANACQVRQTVVASYMSQFSKGRDPREYSRPFDSNKALKEQLGWLAAMAVTSSHGAKTTLSP
jgi:hypothetical protein